LRRAGGHGRPIPRAIVQAVDRGSRRS
jgi:hypothetical protein